MPCSGRESDLDLVAGAELALGDDPQVGARPARLGEALDHRAGRRSAMPSFEHGSRGWQTSSSTVPIRQRSPITAPVTSTPSVVRFSPNIPGGDVAAELLRPPRRVLARVRVDRLVGTAVDAPVGLVVAGEVDALDAHAALDRRLADRAHQRPAAADRDLLRPADVDGDEAGHAMGR